MTPTPEPVVLQEGPVREDDPLRYCGCGGEIFRGFDVALADHLRLTWSCSSCGRIHQLAGAILITGSVRPISAEESEAWHE